MKKNRDKKIWYKSYRFIAFILFIALSACVSIYHTHKALPAGVSYEGDVHHVENVDFLYDLSYEDSGQNRQNKQQIFPRIHDAIEDAENFIIVDMFLYNSYYDGDKEYPELSRDLTDALIKRKKESPDMQIIVISDEVNTTYNAHPSKDFERLKEADIPVIVTDLDRLRDPNWLYSGVYRTAIQWFGEDGTGWVSNPFAKEAPKVTVRSYLRLANVKANHRKVVATDKTAIISSANPHDASGLHSNIAFQVSGNIIGDIVESEASAGHFSDSHVAFPTYEKEETESGDIAIQLLTEGKVKKHLLKALNGAQKGDEIWIGMFYLAERDTVQALSKASKRGVEVRLILDPNQNAFGNEKIGLPNLPVAAELVERGEGLIDIRWYKTDKEQFHSKLALVEKEDETIIMGGSTNFTRRNMEDYNLETNLKIAASQDAKISKEVKHYFEKLWNNTDGKYTVPYADYQDESPFIKYAGYQVQEWLRLETY